MSCTTHVFSNPVHMGGIFTISWPYLVLNLALSGTFWNFNSMGSHLFSQVLPLITFGTHGVISWGMSSFQMFSFSFLILKLTYPLPILNSYFFRSLLQAKDNVV